MKESTRKGLIAYGSSILAAGVIAWLAASHQGFALGGDWAGNFRYLSDGCFVAGVVFTGLGLLTWVSTTGFFDMFGYAMKSLLVLFTPLKKPQEHAKFYEYKMEKEAKRQKAKTTVLFTGIGYILASLVFLYLYYNL